MSTPASTAPRSFADTALSRFDGVHRPPLSWILFGLLLVINFTSIFGFAVFGLHPGFLARWEWAPPIFAASYPFFARLQIVLGFTILGVELTSRVRSTWIMGFLSVFGISAFAELLGTTFGVPFGKYEYTALLGPKILDRVPFLIPLSWYFMALPSFMLADRALRGRSNRWTRMSLGSVLLLTWDLTLDPAMSFLTPFWVWAEPGSYYGMPIRNLAGWFVTGLLIMATLEGFRTQRLTSGLSVRWMQAYYLANLSLPLGMCIAAGLWGTVAMTVVVLAPCFLSLTLTTRGPAANQSSPEALAVQLAESRA